MGTLTNTTSEWENGCLVFRDDAGYIVDVMAPHKAIMPMTLASSGWTVAGVNSGAMAVGVGQQTVSTGGADDDDVDVATGLVFLPDKGLTFEAVLRNDDILKSSVNIGFTDATGEAADNLAFKFATATLTSTATDAAILFCDSDATTNYWRAATVNTNTDSTVIASTVVPVIATAYKLRVDINTDLEASFYLDGELLGTADVDMKTNIPLCAYIGYITREGAVNTLDILAAAAWQWTR